MKNLNINEQKLYKVLVDNQNNELYYDNKRKACLLGLKKLAELSGLSSYGVRKAKDTLENKGFITTYIGFRDGKGSEPDPISVNK